MQTAEQKERVFWMSLPWLDQLTMTHLQTWLLQIQIQIQILILILILILTRTQEPNNLTQERSILTRTPVTMLSMSLALDLKISDCTPEIRRNNNYSCSKRIKWARLTFKATQQPPLKS